MSVKAVCYIIIAKPPAREAALLSAARIRDYVHFTHQKHQHSGIPSL